MEAVVQVQTPSKKLLGSGFGPSFGRDLFITPGGCAARLVLAVAFNNSIPVNNKQHVVRDSTKELKPRGAKRRRNLEDQMDPINVHLFFTKKMSKPKKNYGGQEETNHQKRSRVETAPRIV
jgi:hypothetical protein